MKDFFESLGAMYLMQNGAHWAIKYSEHPSHKHNSVDLLNFGTI